MQLPFSSNNIEHERWFHSLETHSRNAQGKLFGNSRSEASLYHSGSSKDLFLRNFKECWNIIHDGTFLTIIAGFKPEIMFKNVLHRVWFLWVCSICQEQIFWRTAVEGFVITDDRKRKKTWKTENLKIIFPRVFRKELSEFSAQMFLLIGFLTMIL